MTYKKIIYCFLLISFSSCDEKVEVHENYLKVYYNYIIDKNQTVKVRIRYVKKLSDYSKSKSTENKKKSLIFLNRAYLFLSNKTDNSDRLVLNEINRTFKSQGIKARPELSDIKKNKSWLEDEKRIRTRHALTLTSSPDWDRRIYGKWLRRYATSAEQYRFFEDASFEYIEVSGLTDKKLDVEKLFAEDSEEPSFVKRGEYYLSINKKKLVLKYQDKKTSKMNFSYNIFNNELYLNDDFHPFQKVDE